jgi:hypothetical protein
MAYLLAGPFVALIGIAAVFFVLRRKSVEKRSMYSARRSQIEHKVRAARQRTLAPRGHMEQAGVPPPAPISPFAQVQTQPTVTYEAPVFQPPPVAPPAPIAQPQPSAEAMPWEQPSIPPPTPAPSPSSFDFPAAQPDPFAPEQFTPAPVEPFSPAPEPAPSSSDWTPAAEPLPPAETVAPAASAVAPAASSSTAGGWSIVSTAKDTTVTAEAAPKKKKDKRGAPSGSEWQLASGDSVGTDQDETEVKRSSGTVMAVAQYAVLVVGLVMVLIGVLVMVANSHVT